LAVEPHLHSVELAPPKPRQIQRGLSQGLRGERPGVDRGAADFGGPLDQGDALAEVGRLGRAFFAAGSRSQNDQVEPFRLGHSEIDDCRWMIDDRPRAFRCPLSAQERLPDVSADRCELKAESFSNLPSTIAAMARRSLSLLPHVLFVFYCS